MGIRERRVTSQDLKSSTAGDWSPRAEVGVGKSEGRSCRKPSLCHLLPDIPVEIQLRDWLLGAPDSPPHPQAAKHPEVTLHSQLPLCISCWRESCENTGCLQVSPCFSPVSRRG